MNDFPKKIEISHRTIIFIVFFLGLLWFFFTIRETLLQVFVALILMIILNPFVTRLEKYHIPRALSIFVTYLIFIFLASVAIVGILPPLIEQTTNFASTLPNMLRDVSSTLTLGDQLFDEFVSVVSGLPSIAAKYSISIVGNFASIVFILILAFYLLMSRNRINKYFADYFGEDKANEITRVMTVVENKLGGWVIGQLTLMLLVGSSTYVGLLLLGIPFALPLAILAGLFEVIPYAGPILSMIPAVIIGFGVSPVIGFATVALYFLVQQVENYLFVPKVMEKSAGVNPVVTLIALSIGLKMAGILGILMSIPVVILLQIAVKEYMAKS